MPRAEAPWALPLVFCLRVINKINVIFNRGMAQLVARLSGGQEAVSSSLATPTNRKSVRISNDSNTFYFSQILQNLS